MRNEAVIGKLVSDLVNSTAATAQASTKLLQEASALVGALEASRQVMVTPIVGAGNYFFTDHDLTNEQMAQLEAAVHAGACVLAILDWKGVKGKPLESGLYRLARIVAMAEGQVVVAPVGTDENVLQARVTLQDPRRLIWGAYLAPVAEAV